MRKKTDIENKLIARAFTLLKFRPRSEKELRFRLVNYPQRKKITQDKVDDVISYLKDIKLVDDRKFACWWIESRKHQEKKGKTLIRLELLHKGVNNDLIDELLENEYSDKDEYQHACQLLKKKLTSYRGYEKAIVKMKMYQLLLRRGFSGKIIKMAIDEMF